MGNPIRRNGRKNERFLHLGRGNIVFSSRGALADRFSHDFRSIFARFSIDFLTFAQVVWGALSRRNSIDCRFEHAKPDPHETLPIAMNLRVGPFEASRLTRARDPRKSTKIDPKIDSRSARAVSGEIYRKSTQKSIENRRKLTLGASRAPSGSDFWRSGVLG